MVQATSESQEKELSEQSNSQNQVQTQQNQSKFFTYAHILEAQKNKGKGLRIDLDYDPKIFWDSIGVAYYNNFQKKEQFQIGVGWVIDRLKTLNVSSLLDCGTGFGRVLPFLIDSKTIQSAVGVDVCEAMLECSKEYFLPPDHVWCDHISFQDNSWVLDGVIIKEDWKKCPICDAERPAKLSKDIADLSKIVQMKVGDVRKLNNFSSESFDCSFSFECLQHLDEDDVDLALREMVRVSNRIVMLCERWAFPGERFEPHYFSHDYSSRLRDMGLKIAQVSTIGNGLQGVIAIKR